MSERKCSSALLVRVKTSAGTAKQAVYFDLWDKLEETPAQSVTGVAIKLAAMMHWDDELREAWTGKPSELGATMFLAARRDAMRLAGLPHSFGADEPEGEYQDQEEEA